MSCFKKTYLDVKARDAIDILQAVPRSKCRESDKERMSTLMSFIFVVHSFFIYIPKTFVHLFKPSPKRSIFVGVIIFFKKWSIHREIATCKNIDLCSYARRARWRRINNWSTDRCPITMSLWMVKRLCLRRVLRKGFFFDWRVEEQKDPLR